MDGRKPLYLRALLSALIAACLCPGPASAQETGPFAGLDISGGVAGGSSDTTNGGAFGTGVVGDVEFGETVGIGGHIGYRYTPEFSVSLSYRHIRGDIGWIADYSVSKSKFEGTATSDVILLGANYDLRLSHATTASFGAAAGLSFNSFRDIVEMTADTRIFGAVVEDHTKLAPAAQIGAGIRHTIAPNVAVSLDATLAYTGGFETGNTRSGNLGVTLITPYGVKDVWRAKLGASIRFAF